MTQVKLIELNTYVREEERSQIGALRFHGMKLEKEQIENLGNRRKEIIKVQVEINEMENKKERGNQ